MSADCIAPMTITGYNLIRLSSAKIVHVTYYMLLCLQAFLFFLYYASKA